MAERRMFAKSIIDSDLFLDMPLSAQALYFHLSMRADDEGFINNPKKIQRMVGASDDDCKLLIVKRFIIPFESGIVVIRHWKIHNYIQKDRFKPTMCEEERAVLETDNNGAYVMAPDTKCIQAVSKPDTQVRLGKSKDSLEEDSGEPKARRVRRFTPPTLEEVAQYCRELNSKIDPRQFVDYYTANGWVQGRGKPIKDWKAAVRTWNRNEGKMNGGAQRQQETIYREAR